MKDFVTAIRQHPGPVQVTHRVKVQVPGMRQALPTTVGRRTSRRLLGQTAIEYKERHAFAVHRNAWGGAHTGPGIRFLHTTRAASASTCSRSGRTTSRHCRSMRRSSVRRWGRSCTKPATKALPTCSLEELASPSLGSCLIWIWRRWGRRRPLPPTSTPSSRERASSPTRPRVRAPSWSRASQSCTTTSTTIGSNTFLHPTNKQVVDRYNQTFRPTVYARLVAAAAASSSAASSSTQRRRRPSGRQTRAGIGMCAQDIRDVGIRHSSELTLSIMGQLMCGNAVVGGAICGCVKPYTHSNFALALFALALLLSGLHSYFKCGQMSALTSHLHFKCSH